MKRKGKRRSRSRSLEIYVWALMIAWTVVVFGLLVWVILQARQTTTAMMINEGRTHFRRDLALRSWMASHGGVYVPSDERTPPNPYLSHVAEQNIVTPSGKGLTLMNPAYAIRQMNEEFEEMYGIPGHITSLKPLRPENAADEWETKALREMERGASEVSEAVEIEGEPFLRFMRPMITKQACLKCHAHQGYKQGEIRGGVSISVPAAPFLKRERQAIVTQAVSHGLLWLLGVIGIRLGSRGLKRHSQRRDEAEDRLRKTHKQLERSVAELARSNKELEQFAYVASHDLQEPLRMVASYTQLLARRYKGKLDKEAGEFIGYAVDGATRMKEMIESLLQFSRVSTRGQAFKKHAGEKLVKQAMVNLKGAIKESRARVEYQDLPSVRGDEPQLVRLFQNLISNSIKFRGVKAPRINISAKRGKEGWQFSVRDNGMGIGSQYKDKVFAIFQRLHTRDKYPGAGIGLSICRRIVERHGGRIWLDTKAGKGATIHFILSGRAGGTIMTRRKGDRGGGKWLTRKK